MNKNSFTVSKDILIMDDEPYWDISIGDLSIFFDDNISEEKLAMLYAIAYNKLWWLEDDLYDEPFSEEVAERAKEWYEMMLRLQNMIFEILKNEGVIVPESGYLEALEPFMKRNGYKNRDGWWIQDRAPSR